MCENYKPPRAHHCRQCNRYVVEVFVCYITLQPPTLDVFWEWARCMLYPRSLSDELCHRSPLSLDQQLCRAFQLCVLHSVSVLRWCSLFVSHRNGFKEGIVCHGSTILGTLHASEIYLIVFWLIFFKDDPSSTELVMIILNYVACIPVLLAVGCFRLYLYVSLHQTC